MNEMDRLYYCILRKPLLTNVPHNKPPHRIQLAGGLSRTSTQKFFIQKKSLDQLIVDITSLTFSLISVDQISRAKTARPYPRSFLLFLLPEHTPEKQTSERRCGLLPQTNSLSILHRSA